jgi:hypothetical protein
VRWKVVGVWRGADSEQVEDDPVGSEGRRERNKKKNMRRRKKG